MEKKSIRIAMLSCVSDPLAPMGGRQAGGVSIYVLELARFLSRIGITVDVYTRWDNRKAGKTVRLAKKAKLIRLKAGPRNFISQDQLEKYMPEFIEHFLEYKRENHIEYDLIHSHQYVSGRVGLQLKNILRKPLVHTIHSLAHAKQKAGLKKDDTFFERVEIEKQIFNSADCIITNSPYEKIDILKNYKTGEKNIFVIPPGVNFKRFSAVDKTKARKKNSLPANKKILMFAGRMDENKGALVLLDAVKFIRQFYPSLYKNLQVLMFSGDPRIGRSKEKQEHIFKKHLLKKIQENNIRDVISLSPGIDQDKLHYFYSASDILVVPSYYESFGLVAIEAMASGAPVVASNVGGLNWVVQDNITGFHARTKNPKDFARKIAKILNNPHLQDRLSENAAIYVHQHFNWETIAKSVGEIYSNLIKK